MNDISGLTFQMLISIAIFCLKIKLSANEPGIKMSGEQERLIKKAIL